jgi:hypothetical protein
MRMFFAALTLVGAGLLLASGSNYAQDKSEKKEVVLKGKITCNKCDLGKSTECETVIVVKDAKTKKDVVYFFDKGAHGKYHNDTCSTPMNGTVTGTVAVVEKKNVITVKKVDYDK